MRLAGTPSSAHSITFNPSKVKNKNLRSTSLEVFQEIQKATKDSLDRAGASLEVDLYHVRRMPKYLLSSNYVNQFTKTPLTDKKHAMPPPTTPIMDEDILV